MVEQNAATLENEVGTLREEAKSLKILLNEPEAAAPNKIKI